MKVTESTAATAPSQPSTSATSVRAEKRRRSSSSHPSRPHPYAKRSAKAAFIPRFHPTSASSFPPSNVSPSFLPSPGPRVVLRDHCWTEEQRRLRQSIVSANPHIAQAFFASDALPEESFPFTRLLSPSFPCLPYKERRRELKTVVPWGQRRLFLAELDFLSLYADEYAAACTSAGHQPTVVYAGAAPGSHLSYLARLFPALTFVLYDTAPFRVQPSANVELRLESFTDGAALEWGGSSHPPLFICDVRSADLFQCSVQQVDSAIASDLSDQMRWVEAMTPYRALLKFRLPWDDGRTMYLKGQLRLPVWGSQTTTECRLVPDTPIAYATYEHSTYEQQMFHFNTRHRVQIYEQRTEGQDDTAPMTLTEQLCAAVTGERREETRGRKHRDRALSGLDGCYDCTAELFILRHFLDSRPAQQLRLRQAIAQQRGGGSTAAATPIALTPLTSSAPAGAAPFPPPSTSASSVIVSLSPASALSATVAHQRAVIDDLALQLQRVGDGRSDGGQQRGRRTSRGAQLHRREWEERRRERRSWRGRDW